MGDVTPEVMWYGIAFAMTAGASLVTLLGLYAYLAVLRKRWLPLPRLRPGTWTGREVIFAFCVESGFKACIIALLLEIGFFTPLIGPPPDPNGTDPVKAVYALRCISISSPMTLAVVLGLLFAVMFIRTGTRPRHYGLTWARWPANLGLGLAVFLLAWPVIMGIHALAGLTFSSSFDLFTALGKQDPRLWEWLLLGFQTIVAAPVVEEILFRGILQKWLRRATLAGHLTLPFVTLFFGASGFAEYDKQAETYTYHYGPLVFTVLLTAGYAYWLYHLVRRFRLSEAEIQRWQPLPSEPSLLVADSLRESNPLAERAVHLGGPPPIASGQRCRHGKG